MLPYRKGRTDRQGVKQKPAKPTHWWEEAGEITPIRVALFLPPMSQAFHELSVLVSSPCCLPMSFTAMEMPKP